MSYFIAAIAALAGVIIGGFLQYVLTERSARKEYRRRLTTEVYSDFLEGLAMAGVDNTPEAAKFIKVNKAKLCMFASEKVVRKLVQLKTSGTDGFRSAANDVVQAMRHENLPDSEQVENEAIDIIMWRTDT